MKKTLLTIALMLALGLTACGGGSSSSSTDSSLPDSSESSETSSESSETSSESSETSSESSSETANSFVISNKDDLEAAWLLGEANRTMEFTSDPAMNVQLEINKGNLVVESSDTNVVSVSGRVLTAAGEGNATITASWRGLTDSVDVVVSPKAPVLTLEQVRAGIADGTYKEDSVIDFYGRITGTMEPTEDHLYSGVYVQDGDYAMMLYAGTLDENWFGNELAIGDDIYVKGVLSPFEGLMEVKPTEVRLMTAEDNYTVSTPTVINLTGDNWSKNALSNQDSRLFVAENAIYKSGTISDPTSHSTIKFELTKEDGTKVEADLRLNYHIGVEQMTALQTKINGLSAGAVVDLKGVLGWYNGPQMSLQFLADATPDECMVVHQQPNPTALTLSAKETTIQVGGTTQLSVAVEPAGASAAASYVSDNEAVATVSASGLVRAVSVGSATITATSTAVPTLSDTVTITVTSATGPVEAETFVDGGSYKFGVTQTNLGKTLLLTGEMDGYYGATTETYADAATFVVASTTDDGYTLKTGEKYLALTTSGTYVNFAYATEPFVWKYNKTYNTFTAYVESKAADYFIGTSKTHDTLSPNALADIETSFAGHLYDYVLDISPLGTAPADGSSYAIGLNQEKLGTNLYMTGEMAGHYGASTTDPSAAPKFTVNVVGDGYTLKIGDKYLGISESGTYANVSFSNTQFVWTYNAEYDTFTAYVENQESECYIGTYSTYNTFSVSKISFAATSYPMHLYEIETAPDAIGVVLTAETTEVYVGGTLELTPVAFPSCATLAGATYASDNEPVATVTDGVVTGVSAGTANITVTVGTLTSTLAVTVVEAPAGAGEVSAVFSECGFTNAQEMTTTTLGDITITFSVGTGSNTPKYYDSGTNIRIYGGNTVTLTPAATTVMTKIVFTCSSGYVPGSAVTATNGVLSVSDTTVTILVDGAGPVVITNGGTSQVRVTSVTISYVAA